ncbi:MAG: LysM peptidoglycan-binding domain-containing protein [Anaerolineaceae bacterium]|nr:LysM peptidoglycan-binding domain-containing protein [Anaerolineaceae bacterium]
MALEKLKILVETDNNVFNKEITALFNPNQISIQKTVNWRTVSGPERDVPGSNFTFGNPAILTLELFLDTYEQASDVRKYSEELVNLTTVEGRVHRPPICKLSWGKAGIFFKGTLQSLNQRFTLFLADGTPVRATLGCTFKQWRSDKEEIQRQKKQSVDVAKFRTVQRGDTLSGIASKEYHDARLWRAIAKENKINNPRALTPGQVLKIPSLRSHTTTGKENYD